MREPPSPNHHSTFVAQEEAAGFRDAAAVLARARAMAAQQLAVEPAVRAFVRKTIADIATVTTGQSPAVHHTVLSRMTDSF